MPELPEVETALRGIRPYVIGEPVAQVVVRDPRLRWPIPKALGAELPAQTIVRIIRRGKYLLLYGQTGCAILHLGMSGSLRIFPAKTAPEKHDHVDIVFTNGTLLRLRDPRRFGALLWTRGDPLAHPLLANLGPEPWDPAFNGAYLHQRARHRRLPVKSFVMDSRTVAGVGNIYANEALHLAGIHPARRAGRIAHRRYDALVEAIRTVLDAAIAQGGTTLRDFVDSAGRAGYFKQRLRVYHRAGKPCPSCHAPIRQRSIGQRTTFFCSSCQH
ncbi:MAG: bifunctional DNA-formamidopyrimidine glycosylase/DNA-(apurinic or apyrimidinic site) lyase [Gammaproteobacteria bacterium]